MKQRKSDILWKVVIEEVFDDMLRFIFSDADEVYDMERVFEFLEKELAEMYPEPDKAADTRFADKLVKVFHRDGEEEWVLMHVEIQGDTSKRQEFSERMFRYFYRILDRYRKPVSAIAVFTGQDGKRMPCRFEYGYRSTRLMYSIVQWLSWNFRMRNWIVARILLHRSHWLQRRHCWREGYRSKSCWNATY